MLTERMKKMLENNETKFLKKFATRSAEEITRYFAWGFPFSSVFGLILVLQQGINKPLPCQGISKPLPCLRWRNVRIGSAACRDFMCGL